MNNDSLLAYDIYQASHLQGEFLLRSGAISHEYFDKYLFSANPKLLKRIAAAMLPMIPADTEVLAGLELGAIPLVTLLSQGSGLPASFVRKVAKPYGTCKLAEGAAFNGKRVLIVEDVVTSGGQIILSAHELRELGAIIDTALCVIDRQAGGTEKLAEIDIKLSGLFTMDALKAANTA